jgi:hypothetical protein
MQPTHFTCYQVSYIYCLAVGWDRACGTAASDGPIVHPPMTWHEYGALMEYEQRKTKVLGEKLLPVPFCATHTMHGHPWEQTPSKVPTPLLLLPLYGILLRSCTCVYGEFPTQFSARTDFRNIKDLFIYLHYQYLRWNIIEWLENGWKDELQKVWMGAFTSWTWQAMYLQRNIVACYCNHSCSGNTTMHFVFFF